MARAAAAQEILAKQTAKAKAQAGAKAAEALTAAAGEGEGEGAPQDAEAPKTSRRLKGTDTSCDPTKLGAATTLLRWKRVPAETDGQGDGTDEKGSRTELAVDEEALEALSKLESKVRLPPPTLLLISRHFHSCPFTQQCARIGRARAPPPLLPSSLPSPRTPMWHRREDWGYAQSKKRAFLRRRGNE